MNDDTIHDFGELADPGYYARRDNANPTGYYPDQRVRRHRAPSEWGRKFVAGAAGAAVLLFGLLAAPNQTPARAADYTTPVTAMFYYDDSFRHATDHYHPAASGFSSDNPTDVAHQMAGIRNAGMQAIIASWWGQGQHGEATRFPILRNTARAAGLGLIPYYEPEGQASQSVAQIQADLAYLLPLSTVYVGGKPVVFVYNARGDTSNCATVSKWKTATAGFTTWYVNLKVFPGFASCPDQPSSWHQYGPAAPGGESVHLPYSFNISPGFWHYQETAPRLVRDPARWASNVAHLKAANAQWKLVTSWNEWGEATSVEPSPAWQSGSGWGTYVDELHRQLVDGAPAPSPSPTPSSSPTASPSSSPTVSPSPTPSTTSPSPSTSPTASPSPTTSPTTSPSPTPSTTPTGPPAGDLLVMAAGDIVGQDSTGYGTSSNADGWTAALITRYNPQVVLGLGDLQYEDGSLAHYQSGWGRTTCALVLADCDAWGQHVSVVYPAPGNHEYGTSNAGGYRSYFANRLTQIGSDTAVPAGALYYSFDRGAWHFIALDSNVSMSATSAQATWLAADLAANNGRPTVAYWHHPRWSSGEHGNNSFTSPVWNTLVADLDVQLVLNGHDHDYERFAPMGTVGPAAGGLRELVVGTGGRSHYCGNSHVAGQERFDCTSFGLVGLTLHADGSWAWTFHPIAEVGGSGAFTDAGTSGRR